MAQAEVVVIGDQDERVGLGMSRNRDIGCLPAEYVGDMVSLDAALTKPAAQARRKLRIDENAHRALVDKLAAGL